MNEPSNSKTLKTVDKTIIVATGNRGKIAEINDMLKSLGYRVSSLLDLESPPDIIEDANTFEGNAIKKATTVCAIYNCPVLADDSGLEVDALNGAPGVRSARYGEDDPQVLDDKGRYLKLLDAIKDIPENKRTARFKCALAYCKPQLKPEIFFGTLEGKISLEPKGERGFGYDPVFIPNGYSLHLAQLSSDIKKQISHRAKALNQFVSRLKNQPL